MARIGIDLIKNAFSTRNRGILFDHKTYDIVRITHSP